MDFHNNWSFGSSGKAWMHEHSDCIGVDVECTWFRIHGKNALFGGGSSEQMTAKRAREYESF